MPSPARRVTLPRRLNYLRHCHADLCRLGRNNDVGIHADPPDGVGYMILWSFVRLGFERLQVAEAEIRPRVRPFIVALGNWLRAGRHRQSSAWHDLSQKRRADPADIVDYFTTMTHSSSGSRGEDDEKETRSMRCSAALPRRNF